jgi:adenylosuccinate lyase
LNTSLLADCLPQLKVNQIYMTVCATSIKVLLKMRCGLKKQRVTNHDVKAVAIKEIGFIKIQEFIHFGLTSQDINNTAIPLSTKALKRYICLL